jgi:hypothetical protein
MNYTLYIPLDFIYRGEEIHLSYPFIIYENIKDIIEYAFEQKYNIEYKDLSWYLEKGSREFVKDIEALWFYNKIDTYHLYTKDYNFINWLKNKYSVTALNKHIKDLDEWYSEEYYEDPEIYVMYEEEDY